jgi:hypothetical protein
MERTLTHIVRLYLGRNDLILRFEGQAFGRTFSFEETKHYLRSVIDHVETHTRILTNSTADGTLNPVDVRRLLSLPTLCPWVHEPLVLDVCTVQRLAGLLPDRHIVRFMMHDGAVELGVFGGTRSWNFSLD